MALNENPFIPLTIYSLKSPTSLHTYTSFSSIPASFTALELAFGTPPGHTLKPVKIALTIITKPPPNIKEVSKEMNKKVSTNFKNFVNMCLKKDPSERASIDKLLKHRFITKYKKTSPEVLKELFD